jgi:HSP20 family protein
MEPIMADIKRYDPFGGSLDDLFKGFFVRPVRFDPEMPQLQIRMDVKQDEKAYTVSAELPGVKKDDIHVAVDGGAVTISGEVRRETEEKKGEQVLRSERYYGRLERSFLLEHDVDEAAAQARFADGVLTLTLPKKARPGGRRVQIS